MPIILIILLLTCGNAFAATSVTSYAVTWTFDADYPVGQYVTGDYYVVAPSGLSITGITPDGEGQSGAGTNGSMVNPTPGNNQGYSSSADNYSVGLNAGYTMPLALSAGDSLVSTGAASGLYQTWVGDASVLTVVSSAPPAGSFRPPFCGTGKPVHNISEINWSALGTLSPVGTPPGQAEMERAVQRPWVNHSGGAGGSWAIPYNNMPTYGRDISTKVSEIALFLSLNYSQAVKQDTLYGFLQAGLDYYYQMIMPEANEIFAPDGGVNGGQKFVIMFTGSVLDNAAMLATIGGRSGDYLYDGTVNATDHWVPPSDYIHFQMDGQTFYVAQRDVDITALPLWDGADCVEGSEWCPKAGTTDQPYTASHIGMGEWSIRYADVLNQSNADWQTLYRRASSPFIDASGQILVALAMGLKTAWNHDALFDYIDRYVAITNGDPDPFGYTVNSEVSGDAPAAFMQAMWDEYRSNYTATPTGSCISASGTGSMLSAAGTGSVQ